MKTIVKIWFSIVFMMFFTSCEREKTLSPDVLIDGALFGKFSISENQQIRFSRGNLQYNASTDTWRFAEHQWDHVGVDNANIKNEKYDGWIDLFGYGTASKPMTCDADNSYYGNTYLDISKEEYKEQDWGWRNKISNGGNTVHKWRTLTVNELSYLLQSRPHANDWTFAKVNGVLGIILVPDDWEIPQGVNYIPRSNTGVYSTSEWDKLEDAGAVFLPAAGWRNIDPDSHSDPMYRKVTLVEGVGNSGRYWTATPANCYSYKWRGIPFLFDGVKFLIPPMNSDAYSFMYGYSVRLVQDVK